MAENQAKVNKFEEMIGTCDAMLQNIIKLIRKISDIDVPVMVTGASGTGKGNGSPGHSPKEQPESRPVCGDQLRRHTPGTTGIGAVRPREGVLSLGLIAVSPVRWSGPRAVHSS